MCCYQNQTLSTYSQQKYTIEQVGDDLLRQDDEREKAIKTHLHLKPATVSMNTFHPHSSNVAKIIGNTEDVYKTLTGPEIMLFQE